VDGGLVVIDANNRRSPKVLEMTDDEMTEKSQWEDLRFPAADKDEFAAPSLRGNRVHLLADAKRLLLSRGQFPF
jgi:hypothetical protein